ncbi:MAG: SDR family NAD(P)-dependent oxidoreductase [Propionibacteriaceae bacterium]|jgi:NAD(P)-dependent dehydrogenase (short-subunit alcohol dehydrogenase family)|nr:SDR family NAD(P)-dependent oxidoreductase [Propionibacteriaceae bacterium]
MDSLAPLLLGVRTSGAAPERLRAVVAGRLVVVTGASRGIGREVALRVAASGGRVVGLARGEQGLQSLQDEAAGQVEYLAVNLRETDAAEDAGRHIATTWGRPDIVVSNAGQSIHRSVTETFGRFHDIARTAGTNYLGPIAFLLPLLEVMTDAGAGQLISVSTTSVDMLVPNWSAYAASKSAFDSWLSTVAPELREKGVATTVVKLPRVATAMSAPTAGQYPVPELTVTQAADVICRAMIHRPRLVSPWWSRLAVLSRAFPAPFDWVFAQASRLGIRL